MKENQSGLASKFGLSAIDYRQIVSWAKLLELEPEEVFERLLAKPEDSGSMKIETEIAGGRILRLAINLNLLPLESFDWEKGLCIEELKIYSSAEDASFEFYVTEEEFSRITMVDRCLDLDLPCLRKLDCGNMNKLKVSQGRVGVMVNPLRFTSIDLSGVPMLTELDCSWNQLASLRLSCVSKLEKLNCSWNVLRYLDLVGLKKLTKLDCSMNHISDLGNMVAPRLTRLNCHGNELVRLELSGAPKIQQLVCTGNKIVELDIRHLETRESFYFVPPKTRWDEGDLATIRHEVETLLIQRPDQEFD